MKIRQLLPLALTAAPMIAACGGTSLLDPIEPEQVRIELTVSGGFIGAQYTFEVDGETGQVRGIDCQSSCGFDAGEVIEILSEAQVVSLATRVEQAGVLENDGRDYGTECCDIVSYVLEYERGDLRSRIQGSGSRLPEGVVRVIGLIAGLKDGRVPAIVDALTSPDDWPRDAFDLGETSAGSSLITAEVSYGGGCEAHPMDLVFWGDWLESNPVQIEAFISHESFDDPCEAYLTEERHFELLPLRDAFQLSYGLITEPTTVIVRLAVPGATERRLIEVVFE